jgi:NADH:ubiquinone oxidoreductase subunit 6 (subunit J)
MAEISQGAGAVAAARAANRFDIRRIIGAVFVLYGTVLVALGLFGAHHIQVKASGININLWTGLGMLVVAALMIGWALLRPVQPEPPERSRYDPQDSR